MKHAALVFGASLALAPALARADDPAAGQLVAGKTPARAEIDTAIPQAPGFAVIDLSPTAVIDPGAGRVTLASVLQYVDDKGNLKTGFALGGTPYFWFHHPTLDQYQAAFDNNPLSGALARLNVTAGFKSGEAGKPDLVGLGFSTELLGKTRGRDGKDVYADPRLDADLVACLGAAYVRFAGFPDERTTLEQFTTAAEAAWTAAGPDPALPADVPGALPPGLDHEAKHKAWVGTVAYFRWQAQIDAIKAHLATVYSGSVSEAAVKVCNAEAAQRYALRASWTLAGGWAIASKGGFNKAESAGGSVWTAYRQPLGGRSGDAKVNYVTLFGRYDFGRKADVPGGTQDFDKGTVALVLGIDNTSAPKAANVMTMREVTSAAAGSRYKFSGQVGYEYFDYHGVGPMTSKGAAFYALTGDLLVTDNVWLEVKAGAGGVDPRPSGGADNRVTFALKTAL